MMLMGMSVYTYTVYCKYQQHIRYYIHTYIYTCIYVFSSSVRESASLSYGYDETGDLQPILRTSLCNEPERNDTARGDGDGGGDGTTNSESSRIRARTRAK